VRPSGRFLALLVAALLFGSCGGNGDGNDEDKSLHLDPKQCSQASGNAGYFEVYDRIPLELEKGGAKSSDPFDVADRRAGDKGRLGRLNCKHGIALISQYAGNPRPTAPTVVFKNVHRLYRVSTEGQGPEGWIQIESSHAGFGLLEDSTLTALDELPIAADATRPVNPGALPDLRVEGSVAEVGEECAFPGEIVSLSSPINIANRGPGSGPDAIQLRIDRRTRTFELTRHIEQGELLGAVILGRLDPGQTATADPKDRVKELREDNNSFSVPVGPPLTCVPQ